MVNAERDLRPDTIKMLMFINTLDIPVKALFPQDHPALKEADELIARLEVLRAEEVSREAAVESE